jgi:hypothetical protein
MPTYGGKKTVNVILWAVTDVSAFRKIWIKTYKKRCFVAIPKPFYDDSNNKGLYSDHQNYRCKEYIHMVPQEMHIN